MPLHGHVAKHWACLSDVVWNAAGILLGFHKDPLSIQANINFLAKQNQPTVGGVWTSSTTDVHWCCKSTTWVLLAGGVGGLEHVWGEQLCVPLENSVRGLISCSDQSFNGQRDEHIDWYFGVNQNWHTPEQEEEFKDEREMINESFLQMLYWVTKTTNCSCIWFKTSPS